MFFLLLLILQGVRTQDFTPQRYLQQRRPVTPVQYLQPMEQVRKGPILFPNDAPPSPPTPLIVTSRPLSESIARSELNPNNSVAAQSQYHQVKLLPRKKNFESYRFILTTANPVYDFDQENIEAEDQKEKFFKDYETKKIPLVDEENNQQYNKRCQHAPSCSKKAQSTTKDNEEDYEFNEEDNNFDFDFKKLFLRILDDEYDNAHKQQHGALKDEPYKYKSLPDHYFHRKNKVDEHDYSQETNPSDNYAFSYSVKDHKTGDDFSHSQKSTGSATNGEYRVLLPDGRTQIVSYTADENGYKADVRYDEHHNQDNSIDFDYDKDKSLGNNDRHTVKQNYGHNQDYIGHEDILYRPQQTIAPTFKATVPNYEQRHVENTNDYGDKNYNNFQYFNVYPTKAAFVDATANSNDRTLGDLSDNNNDYLEQANARLENNNKEERAKDDYKFSDELVDYSTEFINEDHAYEPHKSKFSSLFNNQNAQTQGQVRPSYDELKPLFVTNPNGRRNAAIPVSTIRPVYAVTPADVVAITPKKPVHNLYTNIKNIVTPAPFIFSTPSPSTPRSYLLSTIANLKHQISLANKPVLSEHYINKINKYLSYSNPVKVNK